MRVRERVTVHDLIEDQVRRTPQATAVGFEGRSLSYAELDTHADRVADWLLSRGLRLEERVSIEVQRSHEMVAAILGVFKAGCAYVPIDYALPDERKQYMREDAGVRVVLDDASLAEALTPAAGPSAAPARPSVGGGNLAYVLYTSGSTGRPKGVMIEHANVVSLVRAMAIEPGISSDDTTLSLTTLSFDVSVAELLLPLAVGACVVIGSRETARDPARIARVMAETNARTFGATPATWRMMVESGWRPDANMEIHCAGEALSRELADALMERGATLWNLYGPTETTVYASGVEVTRGKPITIGPALRNTRLYIVDRDGNPLGPGVPGELLVGGEGVARGYLSRAALTAEKFIPDPWADRPGARLYRTGDLAQWLPNGEVDYLGRIDHQVKIRGFRIELGEIESALRTIPGIVDAVVVAVEVSAGDKRLAAYLKCPAGGVDLEHVQTTLGKTLPEYMVPRAYVTLPTLPLTGTGKVDRKALPPPEWSTNAEEYVAPVDEEEEVVATLLADLLHLPRVGANDDFFALGGHSLIATSLVTRLAARFGRQISVGDVFDAKTPRAIAERLRRAEQRTDEALLPRVDRGSPLPLSPLERPIWFLHQLAETGPAYNECVALRVRGDLDAGALERALAAVVERHEAMRTRWVVVDGSPMRVVDAKGSLPLGIVDARDDATAEEAIRRVARAPYDPTKGPIARAVLVRRAGGDSILALACHHLAIDEWSFFVLVDDLSIAYAAETKGARPAFAPRPIDYADWAAARASAEDRAKPHLAHFVQRMADVEVVELPGDRPRPAKQSSDGEKTRASIGGDLHARIEAFARSESTTSAVVLLATFAAFAHRHTRVNRFAIAMPVAARDRHDVERIVGLFVNMVPIDFDFGDRPSFATLVRRTRTAVLEAQAHADAPYDAIVAATVRDRDPARPALCQIAFAPQPPGADHVRFGDDAAEPFDVDVGVSKFDATLYARRRGEGVFLEMELPTAVFDRATGAAFLDRFERLLAGAMAAPETRVSALPLISDADRRFNQEHAGGLVDWDPDVCAHDLVAAHWGQPAIALEEDDGTGSLTYAELGRRVDHLARWLVAQGIGRGARVAIAADGTAKIVGVLAVMTAGAAYVPLDPNHPEARRALLVEDAGCSELLTNERIAEALDAPLHSKQQLPRVRPTDIAYVLYTSGSTGRPKGVVVPHGAVVSLVKAMNALGLVDGVTTTLSLTTLTFDVSVAEIFLPLGAGAKVVVASRETTRDPALIERALERSQATLVGATPATWTMMTAAGWRPGPNVRVHTAGEALSPALAAALLERGAELWNLYGPTETTVYATGVRVHAGDRITIGGALPNTRVYVVDDALEAVPPGVPGELCLGGAGVAYGYFDRASLTAEKFVPDPFDPRPGRRMYRTGDLVRLLANGRVEYFGRLDHQVKIRGFRIELGEIDAALRGRPGVRDVVTIAREDRSGDKRLVAYLIGGDEDSGALRDALASTLPEYMVPSAFVKLDAFPLTGTGKLDRKALPAPDFGDAKRAYVPPSSATEQTLATIWSEVLGVPRVGVFDDFFALGGHSLLATKVVARLRAALGIALPTNAVLEHTTLGRLAAAIDAEHGRSTATEILRAPRDVPVPLSPLQERLWFLERLEPGSSAYLMQWATLLVGPLDIDALRRALAATIERHESLRTIVIEKEGKAEQIGSSIVPPLAIVEADGAAIDELLVRDAQVPIDLTNGPPLRTTLVRLGTERFALVVTVHHIVCDGWSLALMADEISALYRGRDDTLPPLPVQYRDYAFWQRTLVEGAIGRAQLAWWKTQLAAAPPFLDLATDRPRTTKKTGAYVMGRVGREAADGLVAIARERGATPYMALLAAFSALLGRMTGDDEIVVATPAVHRQRAELEPLVGFFMNTLAMRMPLTGEPTFEQLVDRAKATAVAAYANQDVPFDQVVAEVNPPRDRTRNPIAQVALNLLNQAEATFDLPGITASPLPDIDTASKFDFTLYVTPADGFDLKLHYDAGAFDAARMTRLLRRFETFVASIAAAPSTPVSRLPLAIEDERSVLPDPQAPLDAREHIALPVAFERRATQQPAHLALRGADGDWTYGALEKETRAIASWLRRRSVTDGAIVGIVAERNARSILALLAAARAGASFVVFDASYPVRRLGEQLALVRPKAWIDARTSPTPFATELDSQIARIEHRLSMVEDLRAAEDEPLPPVHDSQRAYVAFTSGTTGQPKGIVGAHRPLAHFADWYAERFAVTDTDCFAVLSGLAHDPFIRDTLVPLALGASVHVPPDDLRLEPDRLAEWLRQEAITIAHVTPSLGNVLAFASAPIESLRWVFFGGEALPGSLIRSLRKVMPHARFANFYGATETPQAMACYVVPEDHGEGVLPIGSGIDDVQILVDRAGALAAVDEEGEIVIRTPYLALGYLDGSQGGFGAGTYRTGDRGRFLPNGDVQVLGRRDAQVKVRGYRVELSEIERVILEQPGVKSAAVVLNEQRRMLVAYVVGAGDTEAITVALRARLPDYMVPGVVMAVDALPLTPNGKLDRLRLPKPAPPKRDTETRRQANATERGLIEIWRTVLGVPDVALDRTFGDLGGDERRAADVAAQVRERFHVDVTPSAITKTTTVSTLAARVVDLLVTGAKR